jgi:hypothetical protein
MNKEAQFKVALKRYLNTHSLYSVEKFLMFKIVSYYVRFFPTVCYMERVKYMYTLYQNVCSFYSILKKYLFVVSLPCFHVVFCFVVAAVICMFCYLYDLFHNPLLPLNLMDPWNVCVCVCVCMYVCICSFLIHSFLCLYDFLLILSFQLLISFFIFSFPSIFPAPPSYLFLTLSPLQLCSYLTEFSNFDFLQVSGIVQKMPTMFSQMNSLCLANLGQWKDRGAAIFQTELLVLSFLELQRQKLRVKAVEEADKSVVSWFRASRHPSTFQRRPVPHLKMEC